MLERKRKNDEENEKKIQEWDPEHDKAITGDPNNVIFVYNLV